MLHRVSRTRKATGIFQAGNTQRGGIDRVVYRR